MVSFDDHLSWTEPNIRPILLELRKRITALGNEIRENVTPQRRITYSVKRIFVELRVQNRCVLVRFFDMGIPDPMNLVRHIP